MKTTRKVDKREQHIKKKLTAAILMLLISSIMTVTSTYAWFTLSTAPEVTGIQTTIGGNGNLEIALADTSTWTEVAAIPETLQQEAASTAEANVTWGNLVDLGAEDTSYGLDKIKLNPAALNKTAGKVNMTALLSYPLYGADGRITTLSSNTVSGTYDGSGFGTTGYGVRAIGATSSMTERQFAYRNAMSGITTSMSATVNGVNSAISRYGTSLANIAVAYGLGGSSFSPEDVDGLINLITETKTQVKNIETSILNAVKAIFVSKFSQDNVIDDVNFELFKSVINNMTYDMIDYDKDAKTLTFLFNIEGQTNPSFNLTENNNMSVITDLIEEYDSVNSILTSALAEANSIDKSITITWNVENGNNIYPALSYLMDPTSEKVTVADMTIDELRSDKEAAANKIIEKMSSGQKIIVNLGEGSSVFYDIAEMVGSLSSKVDATINYAAFTNMKVTVYIEATLPNNTVPSVQGAYIAADALDAPVQGETTATSKIDDIYAFAIDLFVRTNAANSNLELQINPAQRIYSESTNIDTLGHGSSMTFSSTMDEADMIELMNHIKVVFICGDAGDNNGSILSEARLDTRVTTDEETGESVKHYKVNEDGSITVNLRMLKTVEDKDENGNVQGTHTEMITADNEAQKVMALTKDMAHRVSVLVYLDGETVTNADVSTAAESLTGTMNLQFKSSATLVPMDYTGLSLEGLGENQTQTPSEDESTNQENTSGTTDSPEPDAGA